MVSVRVARQMTRFGLTPRVARLASFILPGGLWAARWGRSVGVGHPDRFAGGSALTGLLQRQPDEDFGELVQVGTVA